MAKQGQNVIHLLVKLPQVNGYPPFAAEELDGVGRADGTFEVRGIPFFAKGLARCDVVTVVRVVGDAGLWISEGVSTAGHGTVRVLTRRRGDEASVSERLTSLGIECRVGHGLIAVDVPAEPEESLRVLDLLVRGEESAEWELEIAVAPGGVGDLQYESLLSRIDRARSAR